MSMSCCLSASGPGRSLASSGLQGVRNGSLTAVQQYQMRQAPSRQDPNSLFQMAVQARQLRQACTNGGGFKGRGFPFVPLQRLLPLCCA